MKMAPNPVSRVGLLGLGSIGLLHARLLREHDVDVIGYDPSAQASDQLADIGGTPTSRAAAINDCDAVIIASPNDQHLVDLGDVLGVHNPALVEKPLGHSLTEARRLIEFAESRNVVVSAAYNLRFRSVVRQLRNWLSEELLGEPVIAQFVCGSFLPEWRPSQDYSKGYAADPATGGVIFDIIHEFDLAVHLLGLAHVESAAASRSGLLEIDSEDCAVITLRHDSGALSTLHLDYLRRPAERSINIVGSMGSLHADLRSGEARLTANDGAVIRQHAKAINRDEEYNRQLEDFLNAAANNSRPECSGRDALRSLAMALDARSLAGLPPAAPEVVTLDAGGTS